MKEIKLMFCTAAAFTMVLSSSLAALVSYTNLTAWTTDNGPATGIEDFNAFAVDTTFQNTSVIANNMTVTGEPGSNGLLTNKIDAPDYEFAATYAQDNTPYLLGDLQSTETIRIDFTTAVTAWGGFFRFISDGPRDTRIRVYDAADALLGEVTTFDAESQFFGFGLTTEAADYIVMQNLTSNNDVWGLDNVSFVAIPEPASMGLIGLVSGGIWFTRRFFRA